MFMEIWGNLIGRTIKGTTIWRAIWKNVSELKYVCFDLRILILKIYSKELIK